MTIAYVGKVGETHQESADPELIFDVDVPAGSLLCVCTALRRMAAVSFPGVFQGGGIGPARFLLSANEDASPSSTRAYMSADAVRVSADIAAGDSLYWSYREYPGGVTPVVMGHVAAGYVFSGDWEVEGDNPPWAGTSRVAFPPEGSGWGNSGAVSLNEDLSNVVVDEAVLFGATMTEHLPGMGSVDADWTLIETIADAAGGNKYLMPAYRIVDAPGDYNFTAAITAGKWVTQIGAYKETGLLRRMAQGRGFFSPNS